MSPTETPVIVIKKFQFRKGADDYGFYIMSNNCDNFFVVSVTHFKLNTFSPGNGWCVSKSLIGTIKTCKPQSFPLELVFAITRDVLVVFPTVKPDNIIISPPIQIHKIKSRLPLMGSSHWPEPGQGQGMETWIV